MKLLYKKLIATLLIVFFASLVNAQANNTQVKNSQLDNGLATNKVGGNFFLTDHDSQPFELHQLKNNVVLMFFGYTSCPDICPSELGRMAQILNNFEDRSDKVKGLFISVDPDRDSPQILKGYTAYFSQNLKGLTGSLEEINEVTDLFRVKYEITKNAENRIVVDHSSTLYIIDKKGDLNTMVPYGMSAAHIINVIERLLEE